MQQLTRPWRRVWLVAALALPATLAPSSPLLAQGAPPKDRLTIADYFNWEDVANPALSPDGRQVLS
jgi:hypothetical protein